MTKLVLFATIAALVAIPAAARADGSRETVAAPAGAVLMTLHAVGAQIYACKPDGHGGLAWSFREPIATLLRDGQTVGRHGCPVGEGWTGSMALILLGSGLSPNGPDTKEPMPCCTRIAFSTPC